MSQSSSGLRPTRHGCSFGRMSESNVQQILTDLFIEAAQAHHKATGGANPNWADWYADHLLVALGEATGRPMNKTELRDWLLNADARFSAEPQDKKWPMAYAEWMSDELSTRESPGAPSG